MLSELREQNLFRTDNRIDKSLPKPSPPPPSFFLPGNAGVGPDFFPRSTVFPRKCAKENQLAYQILGKILKSLCRYLSFFQYVKPSLQVPIYFSVYND